jgi:glycerophosphoryl diester phosphodiesterase
MNKPPLIIGHRGASALAPENTLAAFARAMRDGANGIEFDVRLSSDNIPVVIHDATLKRTAGQSIDISALSARQLIGTNVGTWFNRRFPALARTEYDEATVPLLEDVLQQFSNNDAVLYLEMKCENGNYEALARACIGLLNKHSFVDRTIVECFDLKAIAEVKRLDPSIRTAALFEPAIKQPTALVRKRPIVERAEQCQADEIALHHRLVNRRIVERAMQKNMPCVVWTVDKPKWVKRATSLGLKALITNNPSQLNLRVMQSVP